MYIKKKHHHTYLTLENIGIARAKLLFNKYDIPTDVVYFKSGYKKVIYRYKTRSPRLISYFPNGRICYKLYGTFTSDECNPRILLKKETKLPSNYKLQSILVNKKYMPATSFYSKSGNLRYIAYINNKCEYFSPGGQCLLPARIWYHEDGSIKREDDGKYLHGFT